MYSPGVVASGAFAIVACAFLAILVCLAMLSCVGAGEVNAIEQELTEKRELLNKATKDARRQADVVAERSTKTASLAGKGRGLQGRGTDRSSVACEDAVGVVVAVVEEDEMAHGGGPEAHVGPRGVERITSAAACTRDSGSVWLTATTFVQQKDAVDLAHVQV